MRRWGGKGTIGVVEEYIVVHRYAVEMHAPSVVIHFLRDQMRHTRGMKVRTIRSRRIRTAGICDSDLLRRPAQGSPWALKLLPVCAAHRVPCNFLVAVLFSRCSCTVYCSPRHPAAAFAFLYGPGGGTTPRVHRVSSRKPRNRLAYLSLPVGRTEAVRHKLMLINWLQLVTS